MTLETIAYHGNRMFDAVVYFLHGACEVIHAILVWTFQCAMILGGMYLLLRFVGSFPLY